MKNVQRLILAACALAAAANNAHAAPAPTAESEIHSTEPTVWGWYYNRPISWINEEGKKSGLRPIKITSNGEPAKGTLGDPKLNVLFVRNAGAYKVQDWMIVDRSKSDASNFNVPAFRLSNWRVTGLAWHQYEGQNSKLVDWRVAAIQVLDKPLYDAYDVRPFLSQADLLKLPNDGWRVVDIEKYSGKTDVYSAIVVPNVGDNKRKWAWLFGTTKSVIQTTAGDINDVKYRISDFERNSNGTFDALLVEAKGEATKWYSNQVDSTLKNDVLRRHGGFDGVKLTGGIRFTDMLAYRDGKDNLKYDVLTMENGVGKYPISRDIRPNTGDIDAAILKAMSRQGAAATSFALAKNGKVFYRAAYGYADLKTGKPVSHLNTGRIASISKTFTAAAIMRLIGQGKLHLDDTVFGNDGVLSSLTPFDYEGYKGATVKDLEKIRVRHLLNHTAGWDRGTSGDPDAKPDTDSLTCDSTGECEPTMGKLSYITASAQKQGALDNAASVAGIDEIIRWMIKPDDKDFLPVWAPGTKQVYSNFGFTVLQKIIEVKSGLSYKTYIDNMCKYSGLKFYAGPSNPLLPAPNEWTYHDEPGAGTTSNVNWTTVKLDAPVAAPYFHDMKAILGHGGWVCTAENLVKFAANIEGSTSKAWLKPGVFRSMLERPGAIAPDVNRYVGLNWFVEHGKDDNDDILAYWHGGRLGGAGDSELKGWYDRKLSRAFIYNSSASAASNEMMIAVDKLIVALDDKGLLK